MEIFFTILIMTLVVSLSGVVTRVLPFQVPLPLMQIAIGALLAWPTFGLHVEFDPELFLVLFIPPLLFADGWKTPTREFIEHGREILGLALALVVVTVVGIEFGSLVSFSTITETVFAWPGMGKLLIDSVYQLDRPVVVAYVLLATLLFVTVNFLVDILYAALDPRVKLTGDMA